MFTQLDATETQEDDVTSCSEIRRDTNVGDFGNCESSKLALKCTPIFKSCIEMGTPPTTHRSSQSQSQRSGQSESQDDEESSWANVAQNAETTNKTSKSQGQNDMNADWAMAAPDEKTMKTISEGQSQEDEDTARTDAERVGMSKDYGSQDQYHSDASSGISSRLQLEKGVSKSAHPVARTESCVSESDSCPLVARREARILETQNKYDSPLSDESYVHETSQGYSQSESPKGGKCGGRRLSNISRIDESSAVLDSRDVVMCSSTPQIRNCVNLTRLSETKNVRQRKETSGKSLVSETPNVRHGECASGVSCLFRSPNTRSIPGNSSLALPCSAAESSQASYSAEIKNDGERSEYIEKRELFA